ncbi:MAG: hypothetical protein WDN49_01710 [Acetobacteraceae bacterium]
MKDGVTKDARTSARRILLSGRSVRVISQARIDPAIVAALATTSARTSVLPIATRLGQDWNASM